MGLALEDKPLRELLMAAFFKEMFFQENCFFFESIALGEKTSENSIRHSMERWNGSRLFGLRYFQRGLDLISAT